MDMDRPIDLRAVLKVIDSAEVITFRFVTMPHRLLFEARHNEMEFKERVETYNAITGAGYHDLWVRAC